jgi:hypothetical protein
MKTTNKYTGKIILAIAMISVIGFTSCSKFENQLPGQEQNNQKAIHIGEIGSDQTGVNLIAGQNIDAGNVSFEDIDTDGNGEKDALQVTYTTENGWGLYDIHFWIGSSLTTLPTNKSGNPQIGLFPYKYSGLGGATSYSFVIPFTVMGFNCDVTDNYYVAAHAVVKKSVNGSLQSETGWGDGMRLVQKGNWAMYFKLYITCDEEPPLVETATETAFAYGGSYANCFLSYSEFISNPNRWGWTNGALMEGDYSFPIYAGAGQCDITKGTLVGNLLVSYHSGSAVVTYQLSGSNSQTGVAYGIDEIHLYVGTEEFPRNKQGELTIAPGQYPVTASSLNNAVSFSYTVSGLSGPVYVVAHAVVDGFPK